MGSGSANRLATGGGRLPASFGQSMGHRRMTGSNFGRSQGFREGARCTARFPTLAAWIGIDLIIAGVTRHPTPPKTARTERGAWARAGAYGLANSSTSCPISKQPFDAE